MRFNYIKLNQNPYAISSAQVAKTLWPQVEQVITYNTYNKMTSIQEPLDAFMLNIQYGHDHQRIFQELNENGIITAKKTFVGEGLEIVEKPQSGTVQKIHYLSGGDGNLFAMYILDQNNVGTLYYLFTDHLGSPNLITDASGNTVQELSFDAWGKRRDPATWQPFIPGSNTTGTDIGFTGHRHLDIFGLVNMDGRIYDPVIGRFISPDPVLQYPGYTQGLNPYSYCLNNPLRFTDPSGYSIDFFDVFKGFIVTTAFIVNPAMGFAFSMSAATMDGMNAIAKGSGTNLFFDHILPAALFNAATAGSSFAIGKIFGEAGGFWHKLGRASAHGVSNGTIRLAQGGKFEQGFLAGFISSGVSSIKLSDNLLINTAVAAASGGTTEAIGGGKFLNGAVTGAYVFLLNHAKQTELKGTKHPKGMEAYKEAKSRTNNQSRGYKETPFFKVTDTETGKIYFYVMSEYE